MKYLLLSIALSLAFTACASPSILGSATPETVSKTCWDGTVCAQWQDCPNYATPGRCEAPSGMPPEQWMLKRPKDAGHD